MKRKVILFFLFVLAVIGSKGQTAGGFSVSGTVVDSLSKVPEVYATVRLFSSDAKMPVATGLTDEKGHFSLSAKVAGTYKLGVSSIGKCLVERSVILAASKKSVNLGQIFVSAQDASLGEVTVKALRPLVKAEVDKIAYSVKDDPEAETNTAIEMLRKVPMVTVDGEDNIKVNGSSSFKVYVNGKPNQMMSKNPSEVLKNYPAAAIQKIEVITNPGAKYDAEGVAGVLNIVTTSETKTSGYTLTPNIKISNHSIGGGIFGMTQIGKLALAMECGVDNFREANMTGSEERESFASEDSHLFKGTNVGSNRKGQSYYGNLEGSYEFTKKDLLSVSGGFWGYSGHMNNFRTYNMYKLDGSRNYGYNKQSYSKQYYFDVEASADYQHTFKPEQSLTTSYRFSMTPSKNRTTNDYLDIFNVPYELEDLYSDPRNRSYEHTGQLDFTTPFGKHQTFSTGLKFIYRLNKSDNVEKTRTAGTDNAFQVDEERSLNYRHRGYIGAAYAEYTFKKDSFKLVTGLRYEYYHAKVDYPDGKRDEFSSNIGDLVPSVRLGYNLTPTQMFTLGYNMRIGRPGINMLSPYVDHTTYESQSYGNPNLESEKAHNIELAYSNFGPKFNTNTSLTYSLSNDGLTGYSFLDGNVLNTTYDNFLHSKTLTLSQYIMWSITSTTRFNVNAGVSYHDLKVHRTGDHNHGFDAYLWGSIDQTLPWRMKAILNVGGNTKNLSLQGTTPGFWFYGLNLSRTFFKGDRMRVNVWGRYFLSHYLHFRDKTETATYRSSSDVRAEMLRFGVTIRYRFGSLNTQVKKTDKTIENTDVHGGNSGGQKGQGGGDGGM